MGRRRRVPQDLMETILGEGSGGSGEEPALPGPSSPSAGEDAFAWEERPERVGVTFNLSKRLAAELERLRQELRLEGGVRPSRSEIAEVALRIAVEDVRTKGGQSELARRLGERPADRAAGASGVARWTTRRSVDESGFIVESAYDENGEIVDETVVATLSDLPVETEYVDEEGRLVSLAKDEQGNTFEWVMDEEFNTLTARIVQAADREAG